MKKLFFPRLAWSGIRKNRKLYLPYLLSCIGMVMMYYFLQFIACSPLLTQMRGGSSLGLILSLGQYVIAVFALIFLFYTNSFLVRRRYKEFGLYNILGMGKNGIARVVLWESLIVSGISLTGGIFLGIAFSKLAELGLRNAIRYDIDYRITVPFEAVWITFLIFAAIFALITVKSLIQIRRCDPLELLKSESAGEKAPKANWIFAVIGVLLLGGAYTISVVIKNPLSALTLFFVAVIMVIIATYLLFMSGSVALCKLLQKNKKYYYKKQHFVSVSSMMFRMKRNGAGLASICILSTMVLVMISSTSSLFFGENNALKERFPVETEFSVEVHDPKNYTAETAELLKKNYEKIFAEHHFTPKNVTEYRYAAIAGMLKDGVIDPNPTETFNADYDQVYATYFVTLNDYNRILKTHYSLSDGEILLYQARCNFKPSVLKIADLELNIAQRVDRFIDIHDANNSFYPTLMAVVNDFDELEPLNKLTDSYDQFMLTRRCYYGFDGNGNDDDTVAVYNAIQTDFTQWEFLYTEDGGCSYFCSCLPAERDDFFTTFGGLFFVGIILSAVFIFAAAMIIYYKQISEGYEDRGRFTIMQKVGMTRKDIKKSINSQVLTVFFAPLFFAGMHLAFAFPLVWKMLQLFHLNNIKAVILVTVEAFICFSVLYALLYKITAKAYFNIVSSKQE